jgi:peptidoglycan-N-acetylglucosamine deacetylase
LRAGRRYRTQAIRLSAARRPQRSPGWRVAAGALFLLLVVGGAVSVRTWWQTPAPPDERSSAVEAVEPTLVPLAKEPTPETAMAVAPAEVAAPSPNPDAAEAPAAQPLPSRLPDSGPAVALTFDAGADRGYAEDILDTLRAAGVPASFGVTGRWAEENPDLVRRMAADGHQIINHTVDHRSFTGLSDEMGGLPAARRRQELEDADAILAPLIGHTTRPWYRLPYGDDADGISGDVASTGFTRKAGWTVDSLGWRGLNAGDIVARCVKLAEPDAIYVFHVGSTSQDGLALARIIAGVREHGLGFATLERLE